MRQHTAHTSVASAHHHAWVPVLCLLAITVPALAAPPRFSFGERRSYPVDQPPRLAMANSLAVGNFDGDTRPDIAAISADTDGNAAVMLLLSQTNGTFLLQFAALPLSGQLLPFDAIAAGNLVSRTVNDKLDDLALLVPDLNDPDFNDKLVVLGNLGGNPVAFQAPSGPGFGVGDSPVAIAALDFSGDGTLDLAVPDMDAGVVYLYRRLGSTFVSSVGSPLPSGRDLSDPTNVLSGPVAVATGLFNKDALPDLAVALNDDQGVAVHLNAGSPANPVFGVPTVYDTDRNATNDVDPSGVAVADFNHDHHPDIALCNEAGTVTIHINNGDGTFKPAVSYSITGASVDDLAIADFDGDGNADIVTRNGDDTLTILLGNADGTFVIDPSLAAIAVGAGLAGLVVADFNGDGKPDVAVAEESDATVSVLLGGGISPPTLTPTKTGTPTQTGTPTTTATPSASPTQTAAVSPTATAPIAVASRTATPPPTGTPTPTPSPTVLSTKPGDVDCSGSVTPIDVELLEGRLFLEDSEPCDGDDANRDQAVSAADLTALVQILFP